MGITKRKILYLVIATLLALDIAITTMLVLFLVGFKDNHDYRKDFDNADLIFTSSVEKTVAVNGTVVIRFTEEDPFTVTLTTVGTRKYNADGASGEYDVAVSNGTAKVAYIHISVSKVAGIYTYTQTVDGDLVGIKDASVTMTERELKEYIPFDFNRSLFIDMTKLTVSNNGRYRDSTGFDTPIRGYLAYRSQGTGINLGEAFLRWVDLQPVSGQILYDNGAFEKITVLQKSVFDMPLTELAEITKSLSSPYKDAVADRRFDLGEKGFSFAEADSLKGSVVTNFTLQYS